MKKKNMVLLAALALLVGLVAYGTVAYFSGEAHVTNVVTTGDVKIDLVETDANGDPWPKDGMSGVMPGQSVVKKVQVDNVGSGDAWVRVMVDTAITAPNGTQLDDGVLSFDFDQNTWVAGEDGCYYYAVPLKADEITPALFTEVTFSTAMDNDYQGCTVNVTVYAQAVQAKNNPAPNGDVTKIAGWPAIH